MLDARTTHESQGAFIRQLREVLCICGQEMAAIPWATKATECAAHAVCRSAQRLRPIHDRGKRPLAIFGAIPLFADIKVPGMVRKATSVVDQGEGRRC